MPHCTAVKTGRHREAAARAKCPECAGTTPNPATDLLSTPPSAYRLPGRLEAATPSSIVSPLPGVLGDFRGDGHVELDNPGGDAFSRLWARDFTADAGDGYSVKIRMEYYLEEDNDIVVLQEWFVGAYGPDGELIADEYSASHVIAGVESEDDGVDVCNIAVHNDQWDSEFGSTNDEVQFSTEMLEYFSSDANAYRECASVPDVIRAVTDEVHLHRHGVDLANSKAIARLREGRDSLDELTDEDVALALALHHNP